MTFQKVEAILWKPTKSGEEIVGKLLKVETGKKFNNQVYTLETRDGLVNIFSTAVLQDRMKYVELGSRVKIIFNGNAPNKKGQDTKMFEVFVDK
jgi:hypothetical protein